MKYIRGWEDRYSITDDGRVFAHEYIITTKSRWGGVINKKYKSHWLSVNTTKRGDWYMSLALQRTRGYRKGYKIHRLVAEAFIPNPMNLPEVNHKNGIKTDNRAENLEWCTRARNLEHARESGLIPEVQKGADNVNAKLTWMQAEEIRKEYSLYKTPHRKLCLKYGVSFATVGDIIRNKRYISAGS